MNRYILDTDHLTLLKRNHPIVRAKIDTSMTSAKLEDKMLKVPEQYLNGLDGYMLSESSAVGNFIQAHQEITSLLDEAYQELRKYFSSEDLKLELVTDPEIAGEQQLFVYIFTSLSVTDALQKFDEFDEQWWLDRIDRANGLLNFNLRFV
jgi:hypothetical protein